MYTYHNVEDNAMYKFGGSTNVQWTSNGLVVIAAAALSWPSEKFVRSSVAFATKHGCPRNGDRNVVKIQWDERQRMKQVNKRQQALACWFFLRHLWGPLWSREPLEVPHCQQCSGPDRPGSQETAVSVEMRRSWSRSHSKVLKTFLPSGKLT